MSATTALRGVPEQEYGIVAIKRDPARLRGYLASLTKAGAAVFLAGAMFWMMYGQASGDTVFALSRFWLFGLTLPGLLLWRIATARHLNLVEDLAAGSLVGVSVLTLVYLGASALGLQRWAWIWVLPVLVAAVTVPPWRRRCFRRVSAPISPVAAWLTTVATLLPLYTLSRFRDTPAPYSDPRLTSPDMAFHQALAASAKYDFPLQASYVDGEPMAYHYFFHQLAAATSWASGVELTDLIYTIGWLPLLAAGSALIFALTDRLAPRSAWAGPLAIAVATMGGVLQVYPYFGMPGTNTAGYVVASPTQNLGGALIVLLALLAVDLVRGRRGRGTLVLFVVIAAAASGSKATVLPLVVCGFGLVVLVGLFQRRFAWRAVAGTAVAGAMFVAAIVVIFQGHSSGLAVRPWRVFERISAYVAFTDKPLTETDTRALWFSAIVCCLAWLLGSAGLLVHLARFKSSVRDPAIVFLTGVSIAGFMGTVLTDQPGLSQLYFHRTAVPVIAALAAAGAWALVSRFGDCRSGLVVLGFVLTGFAATWGAREVLVDRGLPPPRFRAPDGKLSTEAMVEPWLWVLGLILAGSLLVTLLWKVCRRSGRPTRLVAAGVVIGCLVGGLLPQLQALPNNTSAAPREPTAGSPVGPTASAADAARWLRDHSAPDDLIATNAHCIALGGGCDARHFWIAALTERHILVEGWGYTNTINDLVTDTGDKSNGLPFWDSVRLQENDRVFISGSRDAVQLLRTKYGVRWLYVDQSESAVSRRLGEVAELRHDVGDVQIYELK